MGDGDNEPTVDIYQPEMADVEALADLWVDLAAEQRDHGSHFRAAENRTRIREALARHSVIGGLFAARPTLDAGDQTPGHRGNQSTSPIGFVMFSIESPDYRKHVTRGIVHNLYVHESHRREGIGHILLSRAEEALRRQGADVVVLEVLAPNDAARQFYRRQGYKTHRLELEKDLASESDTHSRDDR